MKYLLQTLMIFLIVIFKFSSGCKLVCYYDISSGEKVGPARFTRNDMELALHFCTHVIYSFVTLTPKINSVTALTSEGERELSGMQYFKLKYPNIKFLLSLGGENNWQTTEKFLKLLEADRFQRKLFAKSLMSVLIKYKFDGLSLDLVLPTEEPEQPNNFFSKIRYGFQKLFYKKCPKDSKASQHKEQLTTLIQQLSENIKELGGLLTLNARPNVDTNKYFDVAEIIKYLDFVVLSAFDFYTPKRNPKEANLMSPIKPVGNLSRSQPVVNVKNLYKQWLRQKVPRYKIVVGVAAFGRSWKMTKNSNSDGVPPVRYTKGPASAGPQTQTPGFLSWPEICDKLAHDRKLTRVIDAKAKSGVYAFRPADSSENFGIWISYEDPITAAAKAIYVRNHNLGGVALIDLNLDDMHGVCSGEKFPILRSIKFRLTRYRS